MKPFVATVAALSLIAGAAAAEVPVSRAASDQFALGVSELTSSSPDRFARALRAFRSAYETSPSWKILGNLGIAAEALERDGEALAAFETYLEEGHATLTRKERAQFKLDIERLRRGSSVAQIQLSDEPTWLVDERQPITGPAVVNRYGPFEGTTEIRLRAGHHVLRAQRQGYLSEPWVGVIVAGGTLEIALDTATPIPSTVGDTAPQLPAALDEAQTAAAPVAGENWNGTAYWSWGFATVGAGASLGLFMKHKAVDREADRVDCTGSGPNPADCLDRKAKDKTAAQWKTASAVSAGLAGTALLTGALFYWWSEPSAGRENASRLDTPPPLQFRAWLSPTAIGLSGRF